MPARHVGHGAEGTGFIAFLAAVPLTTRGREESNGAKRRDVWPLGPGRPWRRPGKRKGILMRTLEATRTASSPTILDVGELEEAGLRVAERRYESAQTIFVAGDPADRLYLLVKGVVQVRKEYGNYRRATVALLKDGGGFGEFDLSGKDRQGASAQAMTACRVASIRKGDLRLAMGRHPVLAVELLRVLSERLRHSEQTIGILLHREVAARLAALMPVLAERFGEHGEDGVGLTIPLTHGEVADMMACTREAVSKALGELRNEGFVELGQRMITITDRAGLREHAASLGISSPVRIG